MLIFPNCSSKDTINSLTVSVKKSNGYTYWTSFLHQWRIRNICAPTTFLNDLLLALAYSRSSVRYARANRYIAGWSLLQIAEKRQSVYSTANYLGWVFEREILKYWLASTTSKCPRWNKIVKKWDILFLQAEKNS